MSSHYTSRSTPSTHDVHRCYPAIYNPVYQGAGTVSSVLTPGSDSKIGNRIHNSHLSEKIYNGEQK